MSAQPVMAATAAHVNAPAAHTLAPGAFVYRRRGALTLADLPALPPPLVPLTDADLAPLRELVRRVARAFFGPPEIVVLDYITTLALPIITDYELGTALRIGPKESGLFCARLIESRLMRVETRIDARRSDMKTYARSFYVLDYKLFCDSTKYKMMRLERSIRAKAQRSVEPRGYVCSACKSRYTPLEAVANRENFVNSSGDQDFRFLCRIDRVVLEEEEPPASAAAAAADHASSVFSSAVLDASALQRLNLRLRPIMELLRLADSVRLPVYNSAIAREQHSRRIAEIRAGVSVKDAGSGYLRAQNTLEKETVVKIEIVDDITLERRRAEEAVAKRKVNSLPIWHRLSTVTGDIGGKTISPSKLAPSESVSASNAAGDGIKERLAGDDARRPCDQSEDTSALLDADASRQKYGQSPRQGENGERNVSRDAKAAAAPHGGRAEEAGVLGQGDGIHGIHGIDGNEGLDSDLRHYLEKYRLSYSEAPSGHSQNLQLKSPPRLPDQQPARKQMRLEAKGLRRLKMDSEIAMRVFESAGRVDLSCLDGMATENDELDFSEADFEECLVESG